MKPEKQIEVMAKLDGFTNIMVTGIGENIGIPDKEYRKTHDVSYYLDDNKEYYELPDYLNDLNATRRVKLKVFKEGVLRVNAYNERLMNITHNLAEYLSPTAAQETEAILKTLRLYEI